MKNLNTLILLLVLTGLAALVSNSSLGGALLPLLILSLAMIKLLLVAFEFMELKKAHRFWQAALISTVVIFLGTICVLTH